MQTSSTGVVRIEPNGKYYLNKRPVAADALPAALRAAFATRPGDHVLYLTAHKDLEYGLVQNALEIAADAGIRAIAMVSETPSHSVTNRR